MCVDLNGIQSPLLSSWDQCEVSLFTTKDELGLPKRQLKSSLVRQSRHKKTKSIDLNKRDLLNQLRMVNKTIHVLNKFRDQKVQVSDTQNLVHFGDIVLHKDRDPHLHTTNEDIYQ